MPSTRLLDRAGRFALTESQREELDRIEVRYVAPRAVPGKPAAPRALPYLPKRATQTVDPAEIERLAAGIVAAVRDGSPTDLPPREKNRAPALLVHAAVAATQQLVADGSSLLAAQIAIADVIGFSAGTLANWTSQARR